jgi:GntR family transcriptional repressor for pyruvate dehydrogenase complex
VTATDAAGQVSRLLLLQSVTPADLVEARMMIEARAAALAAERATEDDLDALSAILDDLDTVADVRQRARLDVAFHLGIAQAAHNRVIETMFGSISMLAEQLIVRSLSDGTVSRHGLPIHREILDALRARNAEAAADAAVRHHAVAERHYGSDYRRTLDQLVHVPSVSADPLA